MRTAHWLTALAAAALLAGPAFAQERPANDGRIQLAQQTTNDKAHQNNGKAAPPKGAPSHSGPPNGGASRGGPAAPHAVAPRGGPGGYSGGGSNAAHPYSGGGRASGPPASAYQRGPAPGRNYDRGYIRSNGRHYGWGNGFWFYDGWYYGDCEWLRRRAEATGDDYWWARFEQCREW